MKELTIEEKAIRYDETIEKASYIKDKVLMEYIFPELAESEDERIRKDLLGYLHTLPNHFSHNGSLVTEWIAWLEKQEHLTTNEYEQGKEDVLWCIKQARKNAKDENDMGTCWFAEKWLEKQGEQKPAWSEENDDDAWLNDIISKAECNLQLNKGEIDFLKSLKGKIQPQTKQEWSEEYKLMKGKTINYINAARMYVDTERVPSQWADECIDWLKSLRPQKQWKPSDEQIKALNEVLNFAANHENPHWNDYIFGTLNNLIRQLKKLTG